MTNKKFWPKARFIKDTRDQVINLKGETGNISIHPDSPKTITDSVSTIIISSGKRTLRITNFGTKNVYYGDATVTSANGDVIFSSGEGLVIENVKDNFIVSLVCATGESTELRIVEY